VADTGAGSGARTSVSHAPEFMPDLKLREWVISIALGGLVFWIGLDTGPFLRTMNGSLSALEHRLTRSAAVETVRRAPEAALPAEAR